MNNEHIPKKPPTLLLLLLLAASCGLMLIHTLNDNVANDGLKNVRNNQAQTNEAYELIP